MPLLAHLNAEEQRTLIHHLKNKGRASATPGKEGEDDMFTMITSNEVETKLAKLSEEENYAMKNRYRHQKLTMDFAEAKRQPVSHEKVRDMLRNQHIFRDKMNSEVGTYQRLQQNTQMENGVLTYLNEAAYGDMKDLVTDVGINRDSIEFHNLSSVRKLKDNHIHDSDTNFHYLMNALFTPLDMTDYEENFVGWNELPGAVPMNRVSWLAPLQEEIYPQID